MEYKEFLDIISKSQIASPTTMTELAWLHRFVCGYSSRRTTPRGQMVDLGTMNGFSAIIMGFAAQKVEGGKVTTVDIHSEELQQVVCDYLAVAELSDVVSPVIGDDLCFLERQDDNSIDVLFIDTDHREEHVYPTLLHALKKVKPGGLVIGHDYAPTEPGVIAAVDRWRENYKSRLLGWATFETMWWTMLRSG